MTTANAQCDFSQRRGEGQDSLPQKPVRRAELYTQWFCSEDLRQDSDTRTSMEGGLPRARPSMPREGGQGEQDMVPAPSKAPRLSWQQSPL